MAIYKLGEIFSITNGSTPYTGNIDFWNPDINWYTPIDLKNNKHTIRKISKNFRKKLLPKGTIMISSRAPIGYIGITKDQSWHSQGIKGFINDEKKVLNKYFFYWLFVNKNKFINISSGTTFNEVSSKNIKSIKGNFPYLNEQRKIIDIIEPLEKMIYMNDQIIKKLEYIVMNLPVNETLENDIFQKIETGKLNVNAIDKNGKYNFYSCSSKVKKTNFNSFKGKYILLSGNGEIYTWWYEGQFDLYQRVYALTEKKSFFTTFLSVKKGLEKIRKRSNGAVIKFIKLSDIKTIKMLNDKYENILKKLFIFQKKLQTLNEKNNILKNKLIKLLIK